MKKALVGFSFAVASLMGCQPSGVLFGKVKVEGGSVDHVSISLLGPARREGLTNELGQFRFDGLPDGNYVVEAELAGAEVERLSILAAVSGGAPQADLTFSFKVPVGGVRGRVVFTDNSAAEQVLISIHGPSSRIVVTDSTGGFVFEGLAPGVYFVAAEAADTQERRVSTSVVVSPGAPVQLASFKFTPTGRVTGRVLSAGSPVVGAEVVVSGMPLSAISNDTGEVTFEGVPAGRQTLVARVGERRGNTSVVVRRGATEAASVEVTEGRALGTIEGSVSFFGAQSPSIIEVTAVGTSVSTRPGANGRYSMQVPVGEWEVVATAPHFPVQSLGRVRVFPSQTTPLRGQTLSWYEEVWSAPGPIVAAWAVVSPTREWAVIRAGPESFATYILYGLASHETRVLFTSRPVAIYFAPSGRRFAFVLNRRLHVFELATGHLEAVGSELNREDSGSRLRFSRDESVVFFWQESPHEGGAVTRVVLHTGETARFPEQGWADGVYRQGEDAFVLLSPGGEVSRVTATAVERGVAYNVRSVESTGTTLLLLSDCDAGACAGQLLGVGAPVAIHGVTFSDQSQPVAVAADWVAVSGLNGKLTHFVRADGALVAAPAGAEQVIVSGDGGRLAVVALSTTDAGSQLALYEDDLPPRPNLALQGVWTGVQSYTLTYQPGGRLAVAMLRATGWELHEVKNGVHSQVADVANVPPVVTTCGSVWRGASDSRWRLSTGGQTALVDGGAMLRFQSTMWPSDAGTVPVLAASFDADSTWLLEGDRLRRSAGGLLSGLRTDGFWEPTGFDYVRISRDDQIIAIREPMLDKIHDEYSDVAIGSAGSKLMVGWSR